MKKSPVSSIDRALDCETDGAGHFRCDWSWNPFYGHSHCTSALACYQFLQKWRQLVLVNSLTVCPGTMVNSMWLTAVIRSENYHTVSSLTCPWWNIGGKLAGQFDKQVSYMKGFCFETNTSSGYLVTNWQSLFFPHLPDSKEPLLEIWSRETKTNKNMEY
jgi:hypothetical protein